jgi:hypothetical protein
VLRRYREIEAKANDHVEQDLRELSALLNPPAV